LIWAEERLSSAVTGLLSTPALEYPEEAEILGGRALERRTKNCLFNDGF
jgi:hypothetical protein